MLTDWQRAVCERDLADTIELLDVMAEMKTKDGDLKARLAAVDISKTRRGAYSFGRGLMWSAMANKLSKQVMEDDRAAELEASDPTAAILQIESALRADRRDLVNDLRQAA